MTEYKTKRLKGAIPFGYKADEHDPYLLIPIPHELDALEKAMEYLKTCSSREVQKWLTATTGRSISHVALYYRQRKQFRDMARERELNEQREETVEA